MRISHDTTVIVNWRDLRHPEAGGAEVYCEEVARRLAAAGRAVVLLTSAVDGRPRTEMVDGYRIVRGGSRLGVYPFVLTWLRRHRRRISGVIDSQNGIPFFAPVAVRRQTPVVLLVHHVHRDQFALYLSPALARLGRWLEGPATRRIYGRRTVVAVSPSTRDGVRRTLGLQGAIYVAPPGCTMSAGPGGGRSATPRLVAVGRLVNHKRVHLLIEAMDSVTARHPDVELHVVGDGPERASLEAMASRTGARIVFHGAATAATRDALVRSSWLGVNCTAGEGWGISVIEANACAVPVVAFRVRGMRDSIRDGETGWLVDEDGDLGGRIADALTELSDPAAAAGWATRTLAWAARSDWDATTRFLGDVVEAERGRLAHHNRRAPTDLGTHVRLPNALVPVDWTPGFRRTDRPVWDDHGLSVLLPGTDLSDVAAALRRAGLPAAVAHDPRIDARIARPTDLVHPGVGPVRATRQEPAVLTVLTSGVVPA